MAYTDPRPAHERLAAELRAQIMDGTITGQLPRTRDLHEDYGVANSTVTKALSVLRAEGFITHSQRGRDAGVFAADWTAHVVDAAAYIAPDDSLRYTPPEVEEVNAPADVARELGQKRAIVRRRLMLRDGEPIELSDSYVPVELARDLGLDSPRKLPGGMSAILEAAGLRQRGFSDVVSARQPTTRELEALRLPANVWILRVLRTITTDGGRVVGVDVICKGAHRYQERYRTTTL